MSQSDYINRKKHAQLLHESVNLGHILPSQQLTTIKSVILPNTIEYETETFDPLLPHNSQRISGIDSTITNIVDCPSFILCSNTQTRANRQTPQMSLFNHRNLNAKNEYYWNAKKNNTLCFNKEFQNCTK